MVGRQSDLEGNQKVVGDVSWSWSSETGQVHWREQEEGIENLAGEERQNAKEGKARQSEEIS